MKKLLLGTTALVAGGMLSAPAFAADPIKLNVGGYFGTFLVLGNGGHKTGATTNRDAGVSIYYEGEIWFIGQTKLDNGTSIGVRVELEAWSNTGGATSTNDQMDEEFIFAFGDWGRLEIGGTDAAPYKMVYTVPSALWSHSFAQHNSGMPARNGDNGALHFGAMLNVAGASGISDNNKITYFTPRFSGLQIGVSYAPGASPTGAASTCGFSGGTGGSAFCGTNSDLYRNQVSVGVNYLNKFGEVSVALFGGAEWAQWDRGAAAANANRGNYEGYVVGLNLGIAGWTFGAAYVYDNNGLGGNNRTQAFGAGVMYTTGPWQASLAWYHGDKKEDRADATIIGGGGGVGKDKVDYFQLGVAYTLGPGIIANGGAYYIANSGQTANEKQDALQFLIGTRLIF